MLVMTLEMTWAQAMLLLAAVLPSPPRLAAVQLYLGSNIGQMGKCGSKNRRVDRLGLDYDQAYAGSSGFGLGGGLGGYPQYGLESSCPEGVDQNTALLATAAAIAVGAGVIYRAVTLQQAGRRRRDAPDQLHTIAGRVKDLVMLGLENIEEYINEGETEANRIDIHEYINHFSRKYLKYTS